jgi:hypothetical protein
MLNFRSILSGVRHCHFARSGSKQDFGCNGSSCRNAASGEGFDRTWVGWNREGTPLSNATGQSFDNIVALHRLGQGWGKIAHNNGLNLGKLVSNANRSAKATAHTRNTRTVHDKNSGVHGKSAAHMGRGHNNRKTRAQGVNHGSRFRSANTGFHGMHGMSHGMSGVGHGGRGR